MIDNNKISELYDKHSRELLIYIYSFVKSQESSEDILHDAFIRLIKHAKDDSITDKNLKSMLYTTAKNLCIDHLRKTKRETETELDENIKSVKNEAIDSLAASELQKKIDDYIKNFDPLSRSIFIMKKELNLTFEDIAGNLNISERTAKRKIKKITEQLIEELKKCDFF